MNAQDEFNEICDRLLDQIKQVQKVNQLSGRPNKQINENDISKAIIKACDVVHIDLSIRKNKKDYTFGIYDPFTMSYIRDTKYITQLVHHIIDNIEPSPNLSISNVVRAVSVYLMAKSDKIRFANIPPNYLIKFINRVINLKTKEIYEFNNELIQDYDFIETLPYNILLPEERKLEPENTVRTVLNDWSNGDDDQLKTIMQLFYAYLDKDGRGLQIILQSEGGDGKSTAMRLIAAMGNEESTLYANINQYTDDNIMNKIQPSTRFISGDDMPSNYKMNSLGLSTFKTLIDGGFLNVSEKYMPNKMVMAQCLKIQATNTDLKFYENNDAVRDRILYIEWPHHNFRRNPSSEINLDYLSGKYGEPDKDFMEALISIIAFETEHFNKFNVTKSMREKTNATLNASDTVLQHVYAMEEECLLDYPVLPLDIAYEHFKYWIKETNPGSKPLRKIDYMRRLRKILFNDEWNYEEGQMRKLAAIKKTDFDINDVSYLYFDENKRSQSLIKRNNILTQQDINQLNELILHSNLSEITSQINDSKLNTYINYLKNHNPKFMLDVSVKLNKPVAYLDDIEKNDLLQAIKDTLLSEE